MNSLLNRSIDHYLYLKDICLFLMGLYGVDHSEMVIMSIEWFGRIEIPFHKFN